MLSELSQTLKEFTIYSLMYITYYISTFVRYLLREYYVKLFPLTIDSILEYEKPQEDNTYNVNDVTNTFINKLISDKTFFNVKKDNTDFIQFNFRLYGDKYVFVFDDKLDWTTINKNKNDVIYALLTETHDEDNTSIYDVTDYIKSIVNMPFDKFDYKYIKDYVDDNFDLDYSNDIKLNFMLMGDDEEAWVDIEF